MAAESGNYEINPGDLVHLREWHDDVGWVILKDTIFMVVSRKDDAIGDSVRNFVQVIGSGMSIETYAGYFVKVTP